MSAAAHTCQTSWKMYFNISSLCRSMHMRYMYILNIYCDIPHWAPVWFSSEKNLNFTNSEADKGYKVSPFQIALWPFGYRLTLLHYYTFLLNFYLCEIFSIIPELWQKIWDLDLSPSNLNHFILEHFFAEAISAKLHVQEWDENIMQQ